jgi:hypothetical protein
MVSKVSRETPTSLLKRSWSATISFLESLDYAQADHLHDRISQLEREVEALKVQLQKRQVRALDQ